MKDIFLVSDFSGPQYGTAANPYSPKTEVEFDSLLDTLLPQESLSLHWAGSFKTQGVYRWGQYARRNLGKGWTIDGTAEIALGTPSNVDNQPIYCLAGPAASVKGITARGNHAALSHGWRGSLRTGSVLLEGAATVDGVTSKDFGAVGAETFVVEIVGSGDIRNSVFTEHDPDCSNDQVTVFRTIASENGESTSPVTSIHEHNLTNAPGSKLVQAHTIYLSPGVVRLNKSVGADVLYYADYFKNSDRTIEHNDAKDCIHGVQLKISPTAGTDLEMPKYFSHERYVIGVNNFQSRGVNVSLDTCGPPTDTRFIRNISVARSLSLENVEYEGKPGAVDITRPPEKKGCGPLRWFA